MCTSLLSTDGFQFLLCIIASTACAARFLSVAALANQSLREQVAQDGSYKVDAKPNKESCF